MGAPLASARDAADLAPAVTLAADEEAIRSAVERTADEIGTERADVAAQRIAEVWAWNLAAPAALLALEGGAPPAIAAGSVAARLTPAPATTVLFAFSDDGSGGPRELASGLAEICRPLIETLNRVSLRPRSALWHGVGDRLAGAFLYAGELAENRPRGEEMAAAALAAPGPLAANLRLQRVEVGDHSEPVQIRNGCCIWHRVPGEEPCITCPLVCAADRERRTREWRASLAGA
jgi:hypothetical protein